MAWQWIPVNKPYFSNNWNASTWFSLGIYWLILLIGLISVISIIAGQLFSYIFIKNSVVNNHGNNISLN